MLYERWRDVARARANEVALVEVSCGRQWRFAELAASAERDRDPGTPVLFPTGASVEFVLMVLRAWRLGRIVCPLELGQIRPEISAALPKDVLHLKTTSATTGTSRLVAFTASQLSADAENIVATMGLRPDWPNLGVISLAHSYGFSNLVLPLVLHGVPLILAESALPESLRRAAAGFPHLTLPGVPALWQAWHSADAIPRNVRLAISAGAPMSPSLEQSVFNRMGLKIHNFYGSSECGGIAFDISLEPRSDAAYVGAPLLNVDVTVGANQCIVVRSPAVGMTYWPDASSALSDGTFRTSDLGEITNQMIYLRGRATDQINIAGRKVSPETIEQELSRHPRVRACVVFGVPSADEQRGEKIVACIATDADLTGESLRQFALAALPSWQVPREWWFVEEIKASSRGKRSRADWRKKYLERSPTCSGGL